MTPFIAQYRFLRENYDCFLLSKRLFYYVDIIMTNDRYIIIPFILQGVLKQGIGNSKKEAIINFKTVNNIPDDIGVVIARSF